MQNWKKGCVFGHIYKFWKGHDRQIKKNACKNAYLGSIFIPEKYVIRVLFVSPWTSLIPPLVIRVAPGALFLKIAFQTPKRIPCFTRYWKKKEKKKKTFHVGHFVFIFVCLFILLLLLLLFTRVYTNVSEWPPGGTHLERWYRRMSGGQDPLFTPLPPLFRSPVEAAWFSSLDPNFEQK